MSHYRGVNGKVGLALLFIGLVMAALQLLTTGHL